MEDLREKALRSIAMKKPLTENGGSNVTPGANESIGTAGHSNGKRNEKHNEKHSERHHDGKQEVSEPIRKYNDSDGSHTKDLNRKESRRSGSSRHRESSRHKSSRHRDSIHKSKKSRRKSSSSRSSKSRGSSDDRRRKRKKERRSRRRSSSSTSSRGRHHSSKYSRRSHKRTRKNSSSSSSGSRRRDRSKDRSSPKVIADKSSHPYFSRLSKIRRERLKKERQERFWDGFQWVSKESIALASQDPTRHLKNADPANGIGKEEKIVTGKDLRRVVATNLPLDYGINQEDLANYIIIKCKENGDDILFRSIFLNYEQNSGIIECMEKEQTNILVKLDGIRLLGHTLHFTKVADESGFIHGGDSENLLQDSAQLTAQAAAIVSSRIRGLQGKGGTTNLNLITDSFSTTKPSKVLKISNAFDRYEEMSAQQFEEMYEDMEEMMLSFGQFDMLKIIRNGEEKLGGK